MQQLPAQARLGRHVEIGLHDLAAGRCHWPRATSTRTRANRSGSSRSTCRYSQDSPRVKMNSGYSSHRSAAARNVASASSTPASQRQSHTGSICELPIILTIMSPGSLPLRSTMMPGMQAPSIGSLIRWLADVASPGPSYVPCVAPEKTRRHHVICEYESHANRTRSLARCSVAASRPGYRCTASLAATTRTQTRTTASVLYLTACRACRASLGRPPGLLGTAVHFVECDATPDPWQPS